jgi:anti-sigma regulatory factor (Ser/Thr protein kinase)
MSPSLRLPEQPETVLAAAPDADGFRPRELRILATVTQLNAARSYASDAARTFGFEGDTLFAVVLAVNEAVTNAIRHGQPDADGMIGLRITADGDRLTFAIRDRGPFVASVPEGGGLHDHGRGFGLMATMMDKVAVSADEQGTVVQLTKLRHCTQG